MPVKKAEAVKKTSPKPSASKVRKVGGKSKDNKLEDFKSVAGQLFKATDTKSGIEVYRETKAKQKASNYSLLLELTDKRTAKKEKVIHIVIKDEATLKANNVFYVAETLPNAVLDLAINGDLYTVRNRKTQEMKKLDKNGKPNGNTAKKGLVEFDYMLIA